MWSLHDLDNDVTWFSAWNFITFSMENIFLTIRCTLVNLNLKLLFLLGDLLTLAGFASLGRINALSFTTAFITRTSSLGIHTRSKLHHHSPHTSSFASGTSLNSCSVSSTNTITFCANSVSLDFELCFLPIVQIFECHFHLLNCGLDLLGSALLTSLASSTHTE